MGTGNNQLKEAAFAHNFFFSSSSIFQVMYFFQ